MMVEPLGREYAIVGTEILLEGARELLGVEYLNRLVNQLPPETNMLPGKPAYRAFLSGEAGGLMQTLENTFGRPGSNGLALRIGRAAFKYGLNQLGDQLGLRTTEFRFLPSPRRIGAGLKILASTVGSMCGCEISVYDQGPSWLWRSDHCLMPGRQAGGPCCFLLAGLLQEFMSWAGGGRFYRVSHEESAASGGAGCTFRLEKKPLD